MFYLGKVMNTCFLCALFFFTTTAIATDLTIEVSGLRNTQGKVVLGIYDSQEAFPKRGQAIKRIVLELSSTSVSTTVDDLAEGVYALAALHDENNDGKINKNMFGMPKEGYGFSNNVRGKLGPPPFNKASFELKADALPLKINIAY